ncbi:hypothetical protein LCGC14_1604670 [marine sediment metagenome]|uniref:Uncharacterized protein n=1 Tax=marine sediment metagenome TaxID=412755 RepID=A0A0F9IAE8_9ZZZZ
MAMIEEYHSWLAEVEGNQHVLDAQMVELQTVRVWLERKIESLTPFPEPEAKLKKE